MKSLEEATKHFQPSRPIFRLSKSPRGSTIEASLRYSSPRQVPEKGDVLSELACTFFSEKFDIRAGRFEVDYDQIAHGIMKQIRVSIPNFIDKNLETRSPKQSKIYRFYYRNIPNNDEFNAIIIMVYKYIRTFADAFMVSSNTEHIKNTIALLQAIMEKYEK